VEAGAQDLDVDVDLNLLPIPGKINRKLPLRGGVSQQGMSTHFFAHQNTLKNTLKIEYSSGNKQGNIIISPKLERALYSILSKNILIF